MMIALILVLTVVSWAQTVTQTTPSTPQESSAPADKGKCCDQMAADSEDAPASCAHHMQHTGDGKEMAGCCSGKHKDAKSCCVGSDAKSCMTGDKDKSAGCGESCGKDKTAATCCGSKDCEKGCCSRKAEKAVSRCSRLGKRS